jgi:hypothetical protein
LPPIREGDEVEPRYWEFPGDRELGEEAYARMLRVPAGWLRGAEMTAAAARAFGVPVSIQTRERWLRAWAWAWAMDRHLDDSEDPTEALAIYREVLQSHGAPAGPLPDWVNAGVAPAVALLMRSLAGIGASDEVIRLALAIGELAPEKRASSRPWAYVRLLARENITCGWLLAACMSPTERHAAGYAAFRRWCGQFLTAWELVDATVDIRNDHAEGSLGVPPNARSYLVLIAHLGWASIKIIVRHPRVFRAVIDCLERLRVAKATRTPAQQGRPG